MHASRRLIFALFGILLVFVAAPEVASAATLSGTYYINDQTGSNCSDANDGRLPSGPWCSFNIVNSSTLAPGTQILLARGSTWYQAFHPLSSSGTSSAWIVVDAYGNGNLPIIRGNGNASDRTIVLTNPDYTSINHVELGYAGEGILVDYTTLNHTGLSFNYIYAHDINTILHRTPQQSDYPNIYNSAAITIGTDVPTPSGSQWAVKDVTVDSVDAYNTQGLYIDTGGGLLTVKDYSPYPPNTIQNVLVKNNWLHNMPAPGIAISSTENSYVQSNHIDCTGHVAEQQGTTCFFNYGTTNIVTSNNVIANMPNTGSNDETGIDLEAYNDNMKEWGNFFYNNAGPGIEMLQLGGRPGDFSTNNSIKNNTFIDNGFDPRWMGTYIWESGSPGDQASGWITDNLTNGSLHGSDYSGFTISNNVAVSSANIYNAAWSFTSTQGSGQWSYQYYNGSSWINFSNFDFNNAWWWQNFAFVAEMRMDPDSSAAPWVARVWTAPRAGTIQIRGQVFKNDPSGGDGVNVLIAKNNTVIWPAGGGTYYIGPVDQVGLTTNVSNVTVAAGDQIHFEVWDGSANNSTGDTTSWMPTVAYTG